MLKIPKDLDFLLEKATFLLLEDTPSFREKLIQDLRDLHIQGIIHEAENLKSAYEVLNSHKIDFIISDWNLPDGNGFDFLVSVRKMDNYTKTPFLMWTTKNEVSNIVSAIKAGANEYFCKPWTPDEVKSKVFQAWGKVHGFN
jgi:two-component system chemotaxis response regulator CheY